LGTNLGTSRTRIQISQNNSMTYCTCLAVGEELSSKSLLVRNRSTSQLSVNPIGRMSPFLRRKRASTNHCAASSRTSTSARRTENQFETVEDRPSKQSKTGGIGRLFGRACCSPSGRTYSQRAPLGDLHSCRDPPIEPRREALLSIARGLWTKA